MIKFGIPTTARKATSNEDEHEGQSLLIINAVKEGEKTKRKMSFSIAAAEKLKIVPGISRVAFSFDGGNFVAVVDDMEGVSDKDKYQVNKELSFFNKKAHEYLVNKFSLNETKDNVFALETTDYEHITVGEFKLIEVSDEVVHEEVREENESITT